MSLQSLLKNQVYFSWVNRDDSSDKANELEGERGILTHL